MHNIFSPNDKYTTNCLMPWKTFSKTVKNKLKEGEYPFSIFLEDLLILFSVQFSYHLHQLDCLHFLSLICLTF